MRAANLSTWLVLLAVFCTGCSHRKSSPPPQAQAPPLQTGKGTLSPPETAQQQEKTTSPLASPLPPPSAQSVPLPPPPPPKKVRHRVKKPAETTQPSTAAAGGSTTAQPSTTGAQALAQATPSQAPVAVSPIGQLTTGDSAMGEKAKRETADLIGGTEQGLNSIKRPLSTEEKVTAAQIHTFLKQAQQALDNGDTDGAHTLATKAKLLLDELTKP
jgi:hypothetical protein